MGKTATTAMQSQAGAAGQSVPGQTQPGPAAAQMPGLRQVQSQVADLRRTLQALMMDEQYADGEIITASAALDAQLEDYYRTLADKKQPGMRTF